MLLLTLLFLLLAGGFLRLAGGFLRLAGCLLRLALCILRLAGGFLAAGQQFSCRWSSIFLLLLAIFLRLAIDIEGTIYLVAILPTVI